MTAAAQGAPDPAGPGVAVRRVDVAAVLDLRHRVLRAGRPRQSARLDGDDDPATIVLAGWLPTSGAGVAGPVSTATVMVQPCPWYPGVPARRLRAMATDPAARGLGAGSAVLAEAVRRARAGGAELLWCHAHQAAVAFYARAGFAVHGPEFDVAGIGPHSCMHLDLAPGTSPDPGTGPAPAADAVAGGEDCRT